MMEYKVIELLFKKPNIKVKFKTTYATVVAGEYFIIPTILTVAETGPFMIGKCVGVTSEQDAKLLLNWVVQRISTKTFDEMVGVDQTALDKIAEQDAIWKALPDEKKVIFIDEVIAEREASILEFPDPNVEPSEEPFVIVEEIVEEVVEEKPIVEETVEEK